MHQGVSVNILIIEAYTDADIGSGSLVENTIKLLTLRFQGASIRRFWVCGGIFHSLYAHTLSDSPVKFVV
jgi:hypothetical protein